ncbi:MAG: helix-turn-helix domain-containing protein [Thermoclostridium sp.]|nr:helix-turn-helix domain-containing protein [Thermoclostridium sp.]
MLSELWDKGFSIVRNVTECPMDSVKMDFHLHDNYEIYLFLSGGIRYFIEKSSYVLVPGDILLMRPGEIHKAAFTTNETYERIVCNFSMEIGKLFSTPEVSLFYCYHNRPHGEKNRLNSTDNEKTELITLFEKMIILNTYHQPWNIQLMIAGFLEAMVKINRVFADETRHSVNHLQHRKLNPILDFIDANLEGNLSLETLEKKFFITGSYLCQIFKQTTGSTLHEYIIYKRISRAKQLLLKGDSAANAAFKCGFSDYSSFVRAFRKVTGYSPREYMKQALA